MASERINDIQGVASQLPITTIEELLEAVSSVGHALRLYSKDPGWLSGN
jgi:hypothetical protein